MNYPVLTLMPTPRLVSNRYPNQTLYHDLCLNMNDGFAYCKVEFDGEGKPVDYVFLDVNKAYRRLIGIHDKPIYGRKATELISSLREDLFDCLKTCATVSLNR